VSRDVVALAGRMPDAGTLHAAIVAAGADLRAVPYADATAVQLTDGDGRVLLTLEEPVLVAVPGEVARLLGAEVAALVPAPVWWIEARAAGTPPEAVDVAYRFAEEVVRRLGGAVWPERP
jgi:hypothetical protein